MPMWKEPHHGWKTSGLDGYYRNHFHIKPFIILSVTLNGAHD